MSEMSIRDRSADVHCLRCGKPLANYHTGDPRCGKCLRIRAIENHVGLAQSYLDDLNSKTSSSAIDRATTAIQKTDAKSVRDDEFESAVVKAKAAIEEIDQEQIETHPELSEVIGRLSKARQRLELI